MLSEQKQIRMVTEMAYDEVSKRATNKYRKKNDLIQIRMQLGERDKIAEHAANRGESMNAFINRAIKETMDRDNTVDINNNESF